MIVMCVWCIAGMLCHDSYITITTSLKLTTRCPNSAQKTHRQPQLNEMRPFVANHETLHRATCPPFNRDGHVYVRN